MMVFFHGGDLDRTVLWGFVLLFFFALLASVFGLTYGVARLAKMWGERYGEVGSDDTSQEENREP